MNRMAIQNVTTCTANKHNNKYPDPTVGTGQLPEQPLQESAHVITLAFPGVQATQGEDS